jgi:hypothetical protein
MSRQSEHDGGRFAPVAFTAQWDLPGSVDRRALVQPQGLRQIIISISLSGIH